MNCAACGRKNDDDQAIYCRYCSAPLFALCAGSDRHVNRPGSRYCSICQAPISVHPALPVPWIGCLSRVLSWLVALALLAVVGHMLHGITVGRLFAVLGVFGLTFVDLDRFFSLLVVVPALVALVSYLVPDPAGRGIRAVLCWILVRVPGLLWKVACWTGRAVWHMAEGKPESKELPRP